MNKKLMMVFIVANTHNDAFPVLADDGSNADQFYCADVVGGRRFAQNYGGYPRSEIAEINEAASLEQQMSLLNDLRDMSPSDNPNAGKTDAEIMLGHRSKYLQTPSESVKWLESQLEDRRSALEQKESKETIKFNENEESVDKV